MRISDWSSDVCSSDLIGLAAGTQQGVEAVLTYLLVYVVTTIGAFLFVMQLRDADGAMVESIPAYAGLSKRQPGLAAAMAVFLFSLAAIPPLLDRQSVVSGKSVSVRVDLGGRRNIKKKKQK